VWTRERVLAASQAWQWVPPGAELLDIGDVRVIDYPAWARMGFYAMPAAVPDPAAAVDAVCAAARERGHASVEWWISPSTEPPGLEQELVRRGAVVSDSADIVALDMSAGAPEIPVPDEVEAIVVDDARRLDDAEAVAAAVWGGAPSSGERREAQLASLGTPLDEEGGFKVVAYLSGTPFATAGCQVVGEVARLYGGCVLPRLRGRGGYRATLRTRLQVAFEHGARLALVHARVGTSKPVLARLGFTAYGEGRVLSSSV
jgi:hypothetical protein